MSRTTDVLPGRRLEFQLVLQSTQSSCLPVIFIVGDWSADSSLFTGNALGQKGFESTTDW